MHNFTEFDKAILIGTVAGFLGGVVFAIVDRILEKLIKDEKIDLADTARSILFGINMGVVLGSLSFVSIFINDISATETNRSNVSIAVAYGLFCPIVVKMTELIFAKKKGWTD